jgi:hypothetical protein
VRPERAGTKPVASEVGIVELPVPPPVRNPDLVRCHYLQTQGEAQRYVDYWYPLYRWFFDDLPLESDRYSELDRDRDRVACERPPRR